MIILGHDLIGEWIEYGAGGMSDRTFDRLRDQLAALGINRDVAYLSEQQARRWAVATAVPA